MEAEHGLLAMELLGRGPVTEVWKAINLSTGRHVALKKPRDNTDGTALAQRLISHEALVCQTVAHRSLPRLLDFDSSGPEPFLCLKLLRGENLDHRKISARPWTLLELIDMVSHVAEALEVLHRAGWVHGDVQPANIFQEFNGNNRLIDLGGAHQSGRHPYEGTATEIELVGSADYWAPEICRCNGVGAPSADIFALGIVAFETLAERRPWPCGSLRETIKRHHGAPAGPLSSRWCRIPAKLARLVNSMLARDPESRPTAAAVADELGSVAIRLMELGAAA